MPSETAQSPGSSNTVAIEVRRPTVTDGAGMRALASRSEPLDLNSTYYYLIFATHFGATSRVALWEGDVVGYVTAYRKPEEPTTLFVWQIAVDPVQRGRGLARRMVAAILDEHPDVRYLEATVTPSNTASERLFRRIAKDREAEVRRSVLFGPSDFGGNHEGETLMHIGPLARKER